MERDLIAGIDPGASGGVTIIDRAGTIAGAWKMCETASDTAELLAEFAPRLRAVYMESVHSFPKQGIASAFKFGMGYGTLIGIILALKIPLVDVSPQKWKKVMGCAMTGADSKTDKKNLSKALCQKLFPTLKVNHAISESTLIAEYGRRTHV